jgi:ribosomal protein S18 acetylase RimI-like enzyme
MHLHAKAQYCFEYYTLLTAQRVNGLYQVSDALLLVDTNCNTEHLNVAILRTEYHSKISIAEKVLAFFGSKKHCIWYDMQHENKALVDTLRANGYVRKDTLPIFYIEPAETRVAQKSVIENIKTLQSKEDLNTFGRIISKNWEPENTAIQEYYSAIPNIDSLASDMFLYHSNAKAVSSVEIAARDSHEGGIFNLSTLADYRRNGYAKQLLTHCILLSQEKHLAYLFLQSSDMAKNLYLDLGFKQLTHYTEWRIK